VRVDVGDAVSAGELLAEKDPVDIDERAAALDASIARASSAAQAAQAQRGDALARQSLARANAERYVELGKQGFFGAAAVEARLQEQASADAGLASADANAAAARHDMQRLVAERAGLRQQRDNVGSRRAPKRRDQPRRRTGSTVVAARPSSGRRPQSLWIRVRFDQGRSGGLAAGLKASIVLRSDPARPLAGTVVRVEPVADSVTEESVAMVGFERPAAGADVRASIGEIAEVTLALPAVQRALVVPSASVQRRGEQTGVWRIEAAPRFAPVRLGVSGLDGRVQVLEGLAAGDTVVVHSERELASGNRVEVVDAIVPGRP
jgi:HlyD family secretion protein